MTSPKPTKEQRRRFAANVRAAILAKHRSVTEFARLHALAYPTVQSWALGLKMPRGINLQRLADACGCSIKALMKGVFT